MCWPSAAQEKLLRACFLSGPAAVREWESWRSDVSLDRLDEFSLRLLPILIRARRENPVEGAVAELATRIHLAQWQQNRQRIALAASIQSTLSSAGIRCVFLKGMALLTRYCGDTGLRAMGDVDFLVQKHDVVNAIEALTRAGWIAEENLAPGEIPSQVRVRHAWQFNRGPEESCDLHWHPLVRCYAPQVAAAFWSGAEPVEFGGLRALVPCATDQLLHACVHGLQWSWTPQTRWVSDAMTIITSRAPIDWRRLSELAAAASMTIRVHAALSYLHDRMEAPVPENVIREFGRRQTAGSPSLDIKHTAVSPSSSIPSANNIDVWEEREYALLQKPCPLGAVDSLSWHVTNFRRIRPYDERWRNKPAGLAFFEYLRAFLRAGSTGGLVASFWHALRSRATRNGKRINQ
jgi:hypothetical protein